MKKNVIALAVAAAAVATGANAGEVYSKDGTSLSIGGRAEARLSIQDGKAKDKTRIRFNVKGITEITNQLYGVGFYEAEYTTADTDPNDLTTGIEHRYTYAGLGGDFGEVTYGKNDGALGVITDFTDIMAYHGNSAAYKLEVANRIDNTLGYVGAFQDLRLKATYRFADRIETASGNFSDNKTDGYSFSGIYNIGDTGVALGAGYAAQGDKDANVESDQYMLAASFTLNDLYLAGVFVDGTNEATSFGKADSTGYEFAAAYTLDQLVFTTSYNYLEVDDNDAVDNFAIDATYYFNPVFRSYISYNFNLLSTKDAGSSADAEDELALGLRYDF